MIGWVARTLAVAAVAPLGLPAHAMADETVTTSGSLTYTWQGDPARGCAAKGLCAVQGVPIVPVAGGETSSGGPGGRSSPWPIDVPLVPSAATVRVSDGPGAGECVDTPSEVDGGDLLITRRRGGMLGQIEGSLSSGRCAGPTEQDLSRVTLPVRSSGGRNPTLNLSATRSFAAGPFTGTLVSTLVVRTKSGGGGFVSVGGPPVVRPAPTHKVLVERVTLRYRIASLPGSLDTSFAGVSNPICTALDSCGATGSLALSLHGYRNTWFVQASRTVAERVSATQAVADFRRGLLRAQTSGIGQPRATATAAVAETFAGPGGLQCEDTSDSRGLQLFPLVGRSGAAVAIVLYGAAGSDLLRTHCPGPTTDDVFGNPGTEVRASIGAARLLARHSVISITSRGSFFGFGYVGRRSGALRFSLTLARVSAGTLEEVRR